MNKLIDLRSLYSMHLYQSYMECTIMALMKISPDRLKDMQ